MKDVIDRIRMADVYLGLLEGITCKEVWNSTRCIHKGHQRDWLDTVKVTHLNCYSHNQELIFLPHLSNSTAFTSIGLKYIKVIKINTNDWDRKIVRNNIFLSLSLAGTFLFYSWL